MSGMLIFASKLGPTIGKIVSLLPEAPANLAILCIPTAANVYPPDGRAWQADEMAALEGVGAKLQLLDVAVATEAALAEAFVSADLIYVTGGNSYYLMEQMGKPHVRNALRAALARGAIYLGVSAGAVVASPRVDFIGAMDDASKANLTSYAGLGLVDFLVMPHCDHPKYGWVAQQQMAALQPPEWCVALRDDQIAVVQGQAVEVY